MADNNSPSLKPPKEAGGSVAGWTELTAAVAAMEKPATLAQLQTCYGTPNSVQFGSPSTLITALASNPSLLQEGAPADIYPNIVWFVTQSDRAAQTIAQILDQFPTLLDPANCGTPDQCGVLAGQVIIGPGGLKEAADGVVASAAPLLQRLPTLVHGVAGPLGDFNSATADLAKADAAAAAASQPDLPPLQAAAAAAATRVGSALGRLEPEVAGLNVAPVVAALVAAMEKMAATWQQVSNGFAAIMNDTTPAQLGSLAYYRDTLHLDQAAADWKAFEQALSEFTANALVQPRPADP